MPDSEPTGNKTKAVKHLIPFMNEKEEEKQ